MKTRAGPYGLGALLLAAAGCTTTPPPVSLMGTPEGVAALVGKWQGQYASAESGRSGSIAFELAAVHDTARGEVVMVPAGADQPLTRAAPDEDRWMPATARTLPELLTIELVRIHGDRVSGVLSPYRDPRCGCTLRTTFEGRLEDDRIHGTFTSQHLEGGAVQHGEWSVTRQRPNT